MNNRRNSPSFTNKGDRRGKPRQNKEGAASIFEKAGFSTPANGLDALAHELTARIDVDFIVEEVTAQLAEHIDIQLRQAVMDSLNGSIKESISTADPHRTWLAEIDRIARNTEDINQLRSAISAYLRQSGIRRIDSFPGSEKKFVIQGSKKADEIVVDQPAYIDAKSGHIILSGKAHGIIHPALENPGERGDDIQ